MGFRNVVITSSAKLDLQMGYLVVRRDDIKKINLTEINMLMIESTAVSITAALLCELVKRKIRVIFCDEKRNPCSEVEPYYGSHDTSAKVRTQIAWSGDIKKAVWTEIVSEKIRKQSELLHEKHKGKEALMLEQYIKEMSFGDENNREGHAAKVYFNALFGMDFTRSADNSINAALNYGYSLILSAVNREISINGYITQLGLFHDNMFNQFNLGSDIMEPFRPVIDRIVLDLQPDRFEHDEKMYMLTAFDQELIVDGRRELLARAIEIYVRSVFDALNDGDPSLVKFYKYEL